MAVSMHHTCAGAHADMVTEANVVDPRFVRAAEYAQRREQTRTDCVVQ